MKWLHVKEYITDIDIFIRYDDINYIMNDDKLFTTLYMKNAKPIYTAKLTNNVIKFLLEEDK